MRNILQASARNVALSSLVSTISSSYLRHVIFFHPLSLSQWKMIIIVSRWYFCGVSTFRTVSRRNTKLSGHVSHLIIPVCRRGACARPEKYDLTSFEREIAFRSPYLGDKSKFPASPRCSEYRDLNLSLQFSRSSETHSACARCLPLYLSSIKF